MVLSVVAVLGFVWSGAAWAQDEVDAACIDNGDGTWSQERQSVEDYIVEGPLTWVYAGQARHQWEPTSVGEYTFTPVDEPPASLPDRLKKLTWHRPGGEIWRVADVDDSWIDPEMLATAEAETEAWVASDVEMVPETWSPENWVNQDCDSENGNEVHVWDGESRVRQSSPFNNREEGAVLIMVDIPNSSLFSICSGVVLRDEWILTVAHCLIDHDGEPFFDDPSDIDVESVFNEHEQAVAAIDSGSYNWTIADEDYDDDWALIKLDTGGFTTDLQDMDLWGGSDSTFQDIGSNVHLLGYPANILDSNDDCVDGDFDLFHMGDALTMATAGARVKFKADSGPQQSGAPYYFCPEGADDTCGSGELGEVVAIHAGYNTVENRQIGPKASSFDDTAIFIMDFF